MNILERIFMNHIAADAKTTGETDCKPKDIDDGRLFTSYQLTKSRFEIVDKHKQTHESLNVAGVTSMTKDYSQHHIGNHSLTLFMLQCIDRIGCGSFDGLIAYDHQGKQKGTKAGEEIEANVCSGSVGIHPQQLLHGEVG